MTEPQSPDPEQSHGSSDMPVPPPTGAGWGDAPPPPPPTPPAGPPRFSVGAALSYGWDKFTLNVGPFLVVGIAFFLVLVVEVVVGLNVGSGFDPTAGLNRGAVLFAFSLLWPTWTALLVLMAVLVRGAVDLAEGRPVTLGSMSSNMDFGQVLIAAVLVSAATAMGLALCYLPGMVVMYFLWFTMWFVVGSGMSAIDAIKASARFAASHADEVLLLALAGGGILLAGMVFCGLGLPVVWPVSVLASTYAFKVLQDEPIAP